MRIHFGIDFDSGAYAPLETARAGVLYAGPRKLLGWLEGRLGRRGYPENTDYLRIELYRQALNQYLTEQSDAAPFFARSFEADRFAAASALLEWRDELLLSGWDFAGGEDLPARLRVFASLESIFRKKTEDESLQPGATGFADRFEDAIKGLKTRRLPISELILYEPEDLYPAHVRRLVEVLRTGGAAVPPVVSSCAADAKSRLGKLQRRLYQALYQHGQDIDDQSTIQDADSSLLILRARRDSDAAIFLAQLLRNNPELRPLFLIPELSLTLEQCLVQEGFPPMGVLSASLARPSLQVLKLAPVLLWEPVDVFKLMEFVTLPVKPLDGGLALEIARVLADKPGLFSDKWFAAIYGYLEQDAVSDEARKQYQFWFDRRRYRADATAPKRDVIEIYRYLQAWAIESADNSANKNSAFPTLAEQARRIRELLEALPETRIGFLDLERIVRTIYEPSPVQAAPAATGCFEFVHSAGAIAQSTETILWWNCHFNNTPPAPDRWSKTERAWLTQCGAPLNTPDKKSRLNLLLQSRPVFQASERLILVIPEQTSGADALPSLLLGDVEALFGSAIKSTTFDIDRAEDRERLSALFQIPVTDFLEPRAARRTRPQLAILRPELLKTSDYETPTNLESLFYYPHRWFFRQQLRLFPAGLLSVTGDQTLFGNLAHRFFELLFQEDFSGMDKNALHAWIDEKAPALLEREGATLLLYGREPERNTFLNRVKNAAWALVNLVRANGWEVEATELEMDGFFAGQPIRGKADLVLRRGHERAIVDLKWSGANRRKELIRNGEDLQLVLYARLLPPEERWPHTAYFILEDGKMIARNQTAFREATAAGREETHEDICTLIFDRMERTFQWRMAQLRRGMLELRTGRTASELEALYEGELMDLLEMKNEDAKWDDYRALLG